jgi:hypothetical protein
MLLALKIQNIVYFIGATINTITWFDKHVAVNIFGLKSIHTVVHTHSMSMKNIQILLLRMIIKEKLLYKE